MEGHTGGRRLFMLLVQCVVLAVSATNAEAQAVTNYYTITGNSTGVGWAVSVRHPKATIFKDCDPIAAGSTSAQLASAFIDCLNGLAWTGSAMANPNDANGFCVTCPAGNFDLGVGAVGTTAPNIVGAAGQPFNPTVSLVSVSGSAAAPSLGPTGIALLVGMLLLSSGFVLALRTRRAPST